MPGQGEDFNLHWPSGRKYLNSAFLPPKGKLSFAALCVLGCTHGWVVPWGGASRGCLEHRGGSTAGLPCPPHPANAAILLYRLPPLFFSLLVFRDSLQPPNGGSSPAAPRTSSSPGSRSLPPPPLRLLFLLAARPHLARPKPRSLPRCLPRPASPALPRGSRGTRPGEGTAGPRLPWAGGG